MGDGTKENPYTREDVLRLIKEHGDTAQPLDLSGKRFQKGIDLRELYLTGIILKEASLIGAHLEGADLMGADLQGADLDLALLDKADLVWANLEGANLHGAHLEGALLGGAKFSLDTTLEYVDWGSYILGDESQDYFPMAADTYRRLKIWHTNAGMYDRASEFYYREMEAKRKDFKSYLKPWHFNCLKLELSHLLFGYGERWERLLFWIPGLILLFALIYFAIGTLTPNTFLNSLYYSAVSFIALGYGSWVKEATGWVKGLGVLETFLGFFMMALLLVTFVRKWTR